MSSNGRWRKHRGKSDVSFFSILGLTTTTGGDDSMQQTRTGGDAADDHRL
jgi:hypothetical protein